MPSITTSVFFQGDVHAAVKEATQRKSVLVVLAVNASSLQEQMDAFEQAKEELTATKAVIICVQQGTQYFNFFNEFCTFYLNIFFSLFFL